MKIYRSNREIYDIRPESSSTQRVVHMGENVLNLTFTTTSALDLRVNDFVIFEDEKYKFKKLVNPARVTRDWYEYTCQLFSPQYDLQDALYILQYESGVGMLDDTVPLFGTASFHLAQIVRCAQRVHPEWRVGDIEEPAEGMNITYSDMDCLQALQHMCSEFNLEYWITNTTISLGKKKHGQPILFKYGKGNALYDLRRENQDGRIVTKLLVKGSDKNLHSSDYGSKYLHLPNGEKYVTRNTDKFGIIEGRANFPEVYPRLIHKTASDPGIVTAVRTDENGFYFFKDANLDFDPEPLPDRNIVVDFQTGQLAGLRIDANWNAEEQEYELITGDYGMGQDMPGDIFIPHTGDLYLLSEIIMPQAYIDMAEAELKEKADDAIAQMCEQKVSYKGTVNPLFFRDLNERIETGRSVIVEDAALVDDTGQVELRVQAFTRNAYEPAPDEEDNPFNSDLDIEISDTLYISRIEKIETALQEVKVETNERIKLGDAYSRRRYRDVEETKEMLEDAKLNFSESINPITIQTMQLIVGDVNLQFRFVNSKTNPVAVNYQATYNNGTKIFRCPQGIIQHMTLGINRVSSSHLPNEYKFWDMPLFESSPLTEASKKYYVYAKVPKNGTQGVFLMSTTAIEFEQVAGYYHLLGWILNSEFEGERSFIKTWGYTEILPGQITTDIIADPDRKLIIDLVNATITGNLTITSGSSGYNNLTDKPDLGVYETKAEFNVFANSITATVSSISGTLDGIVEQSAGWITTDTGNTLWANKTMENGSTIISVINQTAESILISASKVNLVGAVSFSMLTGQATFAQLDTAAQAKINGKADSSGLGTLAYKSAVEKAMLGSTLIAGGYILTSLIDADTIFANAAYIGNFTIANGWLKSNATLDSDVGYIDMRSPYTRIAFGTDLMVSDYGSSRSSLTAKIENYKQSSVSLFETCRMALQLLTAGSQQGNGSSSAVGNDVPIALSAVGSVCINGGLSVFEEVLFDHSITALKLKYFSSFVYQSLTSVTLPGRATIDQLPWFATGDHVGYKGFIRVKILITRYSTSSHVFTCPSDTPMIDSSGNVKATLTLYKGEYCELTYFNGAWYLTEHNWDKN
jgi:hypothetical protein